MVWVVLPKLLWTFASHPECGTGILFPAQTTAAIVEAVSTFETHHHQFQAAVIRAHAERFATPVFQSQYLSLVDRYYHMWKLGIKPQAGVV